MVAVREHSATTPRAGPPLADRGVEVLRGRDLKPLHARCERTLVVRLDDQVHVIVLDAEVADSEVFAARGGQRGLADRLIDAPTTQIADSADRAQRDMHR